MRRPLRILYEPINRSLARFAHHGCVDAIIKVVVTIMEVLFFVGVVGSLVVVAWTTVEDFHLFSNSEEEPAEYVNPDALSSEQPQVSSHA